MVSKLKSKGPSLRASARFASAAAGGFVISKEERETADFAKQARSERERVRALIQAVATESENLESELAEQKLGTKLQGISAAEGPGSAVAVDTAKALRNFNLMRDGDVIAEIKEGQPIVLTEVVSERPDTDTDTDTDRKQSPPQCGSIRI